MSMALVPHGLTPHQMGALAMWQRRREQYGPSGVTPEAHARLVDHGATLVQRRKRPARCRRGHVLTASNTRINYGYRTCLTCFAHNREAVRQRRQAGRRPRWVDTAAGRVNVAVHDRWCRQVGARLWASMLAAHPDSGGTAAKFRAARARWSKFLAAETAWYAGVGVPMPDLKRSAERERKAA